MLNPRDRQVVQTFKQRIQTLTLVKQVVVFSSRARGCHSPDSDLDIFVEIPDVTPELRQKIYTTAWEVGFDYGLVISTFLASTASLISGPLVANPLLKVIKEEGVVV
jgi:predicted nucleotidyltransferase